MSTATGRTPAFALAAVLAGLAAAAVAVAQPAGELEALAPAAVGDYRIGTSDLLSIEVFGVEELQRKVRVLRDGNVTLPLLGPVAIAGLSLEEAEEKIAGLLAEAELVVDPHVTIFVEEYRSRGVSVQGAVQRPGVYQVLASETLLGILGQAGGLSGRDGERASGEIYVVRIEPTGEPVKLTIDAERLFDLGDPTLNIPLQPGDAVLVPFAQQHRVYVSGAVNNPGAVEFLSSEGITLLQAITSAGGPSERAKLGSVVIKRRLDDGTEQQIELNLKRIRRGKDPDVPLQKNDTVVVGDWFF